MRRFNLRRQDLIGISNTPARVKRFAGLRSKIRGRAEVPRWIHAVLPQASTTDTTRTCFSTWSIPASVIGSVVEVGLRVAIGRSVQRASAAHKFRYQRIQLFSTEAEPEMRRSTDLLPALSDR